MSAPALEEKMMIMVRLAILRDEGGAKSAGEPIHLRILGDVGKWFCMVIHSSAVRKGAREKDKPRQD